MWTTHLDIWRFVNKKLLKQPNPAIIKLEVAILKPNSGKLVKCSYQWIKLANNGQQEAVDLNEGP